MKRIVACLLMLMFLGANLSLAQDTQITDYTNQLFGGESTNLFGYDDTNQVNVTDITENYVTFGSPVIEDAMNQKISSYGVIFGTGTIDDANAIDSLIIKPVELTGENTDFNFTLNTTEDNLVVEGIYYVYVVPTDTGIPGNVSREFCFNLEHKIYGIGDECISKVEEAKTNTEPVHNAAGADMELANISETIDGDTITLTRTAIDGSDRLEFFLLNEDETDDDDVKWEKLGEADMMDAKFKFPYDGEHGTSVLIRPDNGGRETVHTIDFTPPVEEQKTEQKPEPAVPVVPETGAKENILIILIISILGFVLYKAMRKTS